MDGSWLLIGTGPMARSYAEVLTAQQRRFRVVSRMPARAAEFGEQVGASGWTTLSCLQARDLAGPVIVCTTPETLATVTTTVIEGGARQVLVEKPGALCSDELASIADRAHVRDADVRIAANRRFYGAVLDLANRLEDDPPVAATFDFTEWPERVEASGRTPATLARWALANSVHVVDTLTHLLGPLTPTDVHVGDRDRLPWHPSGATFVGSGRCGETPVSWASSWIAPGRWSIEIRTRSASYLLAPMEELRVRRPESMQWEVLPRTDVDVMHKPGVHRMVDAFADGDRRLPTLLEFVDSLAAVERIAGYASAAVEVL